MAPEGRIHPVLVPKWGLTMEEGMLVAWHVSEGSTVAKGDELVDIETSKIANTVEAMHTGILRRQVATAGQSYPCGALIGVIAEASVPDEEIEAFVAEHAHATPEVPGEATVAGPQTLEVQGHALRYLALGGGGVPILLIHGFGGDLNNWLFVQPALAESRATYAVDLPGHGSSSKDLSGIGSFADVATGLWSLMDALTVDKLHIAAHSMGAAIALAMSRSQAERIASLTLLSPAGLGVVPKEFMSGLIGARSRREISNLTRMLFADEARVNRELVDNLQRYKRLDGVEVALQRFAGFLSSENRAVSEALAGVTSPVHLVWGAKDRILPPLTVGELPSNVRLTVLEGAGHMPHLERSSQVVEIIEKNLND